MRSSCMCSIFPVESLDARLNPRCVAQSIVCSISAQASEVMSVWFLERVAFRTANDEEVARVRLMCVRAAHASGEWDAAHSHLRALCLAHPSSEVDWALFNAVSGRARTRGYDERWLLRLLMRERHGSRLTAVGVAHYCFLSRSFKIALVEYMRLHERRPTAPLPLLCVAVSQMLLVMSRSNRDRGHSVLLAFGWFGAYAKKAGELEVLYNVARAHHHLGLCDLAANWYERFLHVKQRHNCGPLIVASRAQPRKAQPMRFAQGPPATKDFSRETAHNLARILCASSNKDLARCVIRSVAV